MTNTQYSQAPVSARLRAAAYALALLIALAALMSYFARFMDADVPSFTQTSELSGAWQASDAQPNPLSEASYAAFEGMVTLCREVPALPRSYGGAHMELRPCAGCRIVSVQIYGHDMYSHTSGNLEGSTIIPLPNAGCRVVILAHHSAGHAELPELALISDAAVYAQAAASACPAAAYAVLGAAMLGMALYGVSRGHADMFLVTIGACALIQSVLKATSFAVLMQAAHMDGRALAVMRFISVTAPALIIATKMTCCRRAYLMLASIGALGAAVALMVDIVPDLMPEWAMRAQELFFLPMLALPVCILSECRRGSEWAGIFARTGIWLAALFALAACMGGGLLAHAADMVSSAIAHSPRRLFGAFARTVMLSGGVTCVILSMRSMAKSRAQLAELSLRSRLMEENSARTQRSAEELAALRHDMLHHLSAMQRLSDAGESEVLGRYIGGLARTAASIPPLRYCAEPLINAVLGSELERARLKDIEVECSAQLPSCIKLPEADVCTVLANLLSNAIDAQRFAQPGQRRWLRVKLRSDGANLYIEVENARFKPVLIDEKTGLCLSDKPGMRHGLGLKSAQAVLKKHGSMLRIALPEGAFRVSTLMPIR